MNTFEYRGFTGSAEISLEDRWLCGQILKVTDLVLYAAETVPALEIAFKEAVDQYLDDCIALGRKPRMREIASGS